MGYAFAEDIDFVAFFPFFAYVVGKYLKLFIEDGLGRGAEFYFYRVSCCHGDGEKGVVARQGEIDVLVGGGVVRGFGKVGEP